MARWPAWTKAPTTCRTTWWRKSTPGSGSSRPQTTLASWTPWTGAARRAARAVTLICITGLSSPEIRSPLHSSCLTTPAICGRGCETRPAMGLSGNASLFCPAAPRFRAVWRAWADVRPAGHRGRGRATRGSGGFRLSLITGRCPALLRWHPWSALLRGGPQGFCQAPQPAHAWTLIAATFSSGDSRSHPFISPLDRPNQWSGGCDNDATRCKRDQGRGRKAVATPLAALSAEKNYFATLKPRLPPICLYGDWRGGNGSDRSSLNPAGFDKSMEKERLDASWRSLAPIARPFVHYMMTNLREIGVV